MFCANRYDRNSLTLHAQPDSGVGMLVVIDPSVADYQFLAAGVLPGAETIVLEPHRDAIGQITMALARHREHRAFSLHIVCHGAPGKLYLGKTSLNAPNLALYRQQLLEWGVGEILLYSCEVAAGKVGTAFVEQLSRLTGADIAASSRRVGNAALGGSWHLESYSGEVSSGLAFVPDVVREYSGVFPIQFSTHDSYLVYEDGTYAGDPVTVIRTGTTPNVTVDVVFGTFYDTATGGSSFIPGTPGIDYVNTTYTVTFAAGQTSAVVPLTINPDGITEGTEAFGLTLRNATGPEEIHPIDFSNVNILEPTMIAGFSEAKYQVNEDGTPVGVEVTVERANIGLADNPFTGLGSLGGIGGLLGGSSGGSLGGSIPPIFQVSLPGSSVDVQLIDGTATGGGVDFINDTITVNFAADQTSATISVPIGSRIIDDTTVEPPEELTLQLVNASLPTTFSHPTATLEILDNDEVPQTSEIQGRKWHDIDGDGVLDPGEEALADWTIFLDANDNGQLDPGELSTVTDANGEYSFADLTPGDYTVAEVMQDGWEPLRGPYDISLGAGEVVSDVNFGNQPVVPDDPDPTSEINGSKWHDIDCDGIWDDGEEGLAGWTIFLDANNNGQLDAGEISTVTDASGAYSFADLTAGDYVVAEVMQDGFQHTFPENGNHTITLSAGEVASDVNFGNIHIDSFNAINGTPRRDRLQGTDENDIITGFQGRDTLTGGAGIDKFVYTSIIDGGDIITDFEVGVDKIVMADVLDGFGYSGTDPIAEGYIGFRSRGDDTIITIDPDGAGSGRSRSFILVQDVSSAALNDLSNFLL